MSICYEHNTIMQEPEKDPLEISEDICIKEEVLEQSIKQDTIGSDIYDGLILPKIVDVKDLLNNIKTECKLIEDSKKSEVSFNTQKSTLNDKKIKQVLKNHSFIKKIKKPKSISTCLIPKIQTLVSNDVTATISQTDKVLKPSSSEKPTIIVKNFANLIDFKNISNIVNANNILFNRKLHIPSKITSTSKVLLPIGNDKSKCNCMQYIELFCSNCNSSFFYNKDLTQCSKCKKLLKLQCRQCFKRYSYLSSVHLRILELTKRQNLLRENNAIKYNYVKKMIYLCSKCKNTFDCKEKLDEHVLHHHASPKFPAITSKPFVSATKLPVAISKPSLTVTNLSETVPRPQITIPNRQDSLENNNQLIRLWCRSCDKGMENPKILFFKAKCVNCNIDMVFQCEMCNRWYLKMINAQKHVKSCSGINNVFSCNYCCYQGKKKETFLEHINVYHASVTCPTCKKKFLNGNMLKKHKASNLCLEKKTHMVVEKNNKIIDDKNKVDNIDFSEASSDESNDLTEDEIDNDIQNKMNIEDCYMIVDKDPATLLQKITGSSSSALDWDKIVSYYCVICNITSPMKFYQKRPVCKGCTSKFSYQCNYCKQRFQDPKAIFLHVKVECTKQEELKCQLCTFSTTRKNFLFTHIKNYHTIFKCLKCHVNYGGFRIIINHIYKCKVSLKHNREHLKKLIAIFCTSCNKTVNKEIQRYSNKPVCQKCSAPAHYRCLKCKNFFKSYKIAFKHITFICKPKYACELCNFKAYELNELAVHINSIHSS